MKWFQFMFPGDPVASAIEMTREEFVEEFRRNRTSTPDACMREFKEFLEGVMGHPVAIVSLSGGVTEDDPIICDCCNAVLAEDDQVMIVRGSRGYCPKCSEEYVKPHCKPIGCG